ncbi:MAG TPA: SUMF1/EgtB/PvdO family nonheme iron enzyme [Phycisphaerae bacterium]|nr:SUMF1/EgtB/PvdO family nonheme iron enzyme [Phycisphaerae bacterium]
MGRLHKRYPSARAWMVAIACGLLLVAAAVRGEDRWQALYNVRIENVTVAPRDARTATIKFDISWPESWRDTTNHDAGWVFFKVRAAGATEWQHVRLAADKVLNPAGYGQTGGTPLDFIVPDGDDGFTGMFVRRAAEGKGFLSARGATAVWDLAASKVAAKDLGGVSIRTFAIQMVYVAEGPFLLGSGGAELNGFYKYTDGSQAILPYQVTSAEPIATGRREGRLWVRRRERDMLEDGGEIPASFPNGYAAFYCMKYAITMVQYAEFLNTLPPAQAEARHPGPRWKRTGEPLNRTYSAEETGGRNQGPGAHGLSWADGAAFAAWAGLRPMTELELEKALRGPREAAPDEVGSSYWHVGGFDTWDWHAFKLESQSERTVTVGNAAGRKFAGTHGRGTTALPADWPQDDAVGAGMRCSWYTPSYPRDAKPYPRGVTFIGLDLPRTRTSDRLHAAFVDPHRHPHHKWRGVRTAPEELAK